MTYHYIIQQLKRFDQEEAELTYVKYILVILIVGLFGFMIWGGLTIASDKVEDYFDLFMSGLGISAFELALWVYTEMKSGTTRKHRREFLQQMERLEMRGDVKKEEMEKLVMDLYHGKLTKD